MNARERLLLIALVAVVGVGGFGIGTYVWFVKPLLAYKKTIQTMNEEVNLEQEKLNTFLSERKKLEWARLKSLPIKPEDASSEYQNYLERMLEQTGYVNDKKVEGKGLKLLGINSTPAVKVKPVTPIANVKEVGHLLMSFTLSARGELADLIKFMELLQATPYEHRIKNLTVDRVDNAVGKNASKTLTINMTIETLLVAKNQNKPGHPPGVDPKYMVYDHIAGRSGIAPMGWGVIGSMIALKKAAPTPEDRIYADIARKNIFVGLVPTPRPPPEGSATQPPPPPPPPPPGNIPAYIRLVHTVPTHKEAYLINLFYRNEELKLSADAKTGYQVRRISDDNGDYVFFFMKVLRVDSGVVYFQIEKHVFAIKLGQTLADAIQDPLSLDRMDDLDLDWDREWAKEQMKNKEAEETSTKKTPTKKTGKKG